jgi:ABC-type nitrate/sulfonate/bicarbonate transport system substrate-binding protein
VMGNRARVRAWVPYLVTVPLLVACAIAWRSLPEVRAEGAFQAVESAPDHDTLRVGIPSNCYGGLLAVGVRRDLFESAGVPVTLIPFRNGRGALRSLLAGGMDLAVVGDIPIASTSLERDDFVVLAVLGHSAFDHWVVARPGLGSPDALRGKRIATQKRSGSHYVLEAYLDRVGVPLSDVEIVDMTAEEMPRALASGRVDAFAVEHPYSVPSHEEFGIDVDELPDPGAYRLAFALVARRAVVERSSDRIEALLRQLLAAQTAWRADPDAGVHDLSEILLLDPAKAAIECRHADFALGLDGDEVDAIGREQAWFSKHGKGYGKPAPGLTQLVDADPLRQVSPGEVRLQPSDLDVKTPRSPRPSRSSP